MNLKTTFGKLEFHHIGIATKFIENDIHSYTLLGYERESNIFEDVNQGIRGLFMVQKNGPRIELLENLEGHNALCPYLKRHNKMYHIGYYVDIDIEEYIQEHSIKRIIKPPIYSTYFKKRICFYMMDNMQLIELIER